MSLTFVQGDTGPDIEATIYLEDDPTTVTDLSDCDVRFQMRRDEDRRYMVNSPAVVTDAATGAVRYSWGANDLNMPGTYQAQFEVTFPGGRVITTAPLVTLTVRRQ